jgi:hypothetical protein
MPAGIRALHHARGIYSVRPSGRLVAKNEYSLAI